VEKYKVGAAVKRHILGIVGVSLGTFLVTAKFGGNGLLIYIPVVSAIIYLQIRYKIITKLALLISEAISHLISFILQVFMVIGGRKTSVSGWVNAQDWGEPSESLWGKSVKEKKHYITSHKITSYIVAIVVLIGLDFGLGITANHLYPVDPLNEEEKLTYVLINGENLEQIQKDGEKFKIDIDILYPLEANSDRLWQVSDGSSETLNYSKESGRMTVNPENYDYTIAVLGGSNAFGMAQEDSKTISSELSKILNTQGYKVKVENFGVPAYTTYQAAKLLEEKLEEGSRYDQVVVISGINDMQLGLYGEKVPKTLLDAEIEKYFSLNPLLFWADNSVVARITGYTKRIGRPVMVRQPQLIQNSQITYSDYANPNTKNSVEYNLKEGAEAFKKISQQYKIPIEFVWVPRKMVSLNREEGGAPNLTITLLNSRKKTVATIVKEENFTDLDKALIPSKCFVDEVHTINSCSKMQAELIAKNLVKKLKNKNLSSN